MSFLNCPCNPHDDGRSRSQVAPNAERPSEAREDEFLWPLVGAFTELAASRRQNCQLMQALADKMGGGGECHPKEEVKEHASEVLAEASPLEGGAGEAAVASADQQGKLSAKEREDELASVEERIIRQEKEELLRAEEKRVTEVEERKMTEEKAKKEEEKRIKLVEEGEKSMMMMKKRKRNMIVMKRTMVMMMLRKTMVMMMMMKRSMVMMNQALHMKFLLQTYS
ncbi:MAP7 domain-containing protein 2-like [Nerophis ophidion]|uniref:MAP7 domain-containing protein 2-like n=1 Tax=Nerophis ophidion TaxID=159077 RepID=UPI002AE0B1AB|nr:MAP7 domain-containing protein 2-like [Nerophis ophidion]